ncbi:hypothetical protein cypCar_00042798 [Cyprinus carpio]|nr:hypothetical protein cypCar_00042798 [Cyprinus carpio]
MCVFQDRGDEFTYTGSGGRDLSGNKRIGEHSFDQTLTHMNRALALNCDAPLNDKDGAESRNWRAGKPDGDESHLHRHARSDLSGNNASASTRSIDAHTHEQEPGDAVSPTPARERRDLLRNKRIGEHSSITLTHMNGDPPRLQLHTPLCM